MGFNNPSWSWGELEAALSGRGRDGRAPGSPSWNAGGDGPAWSRRRQPFQAPEGVRAGTGTPYAELHCHSSFSFLDGASHPEELAVEAARLGLTALAVTDVDGFYGVVRFAEAAREVGLRTLFGAELVHLPVLADGPDGYARLARTVSLGQLAGSKGAPVFTLEGVADGVAGHGVGAHRHPRGRHREAPVDRFGRPLTSDAADAYRRLQ